MHSKVQAVIWDLDDTLIDTKGILSRAQDIALDTLNIPVDMHSQFRVYWNRLLWYFDEDDYFGIFRAIRYEYQDRLAHLSDEELLRAAQESFGIWSQGIPAHAFATECLEWLLQNNVMIAIVTNGKPEYQHLKIRQADLNRYFPGDRVYVGKSRTQSGKPNPETLLECCHTIGVPPQNAIYIGDRISDVIAANLANMLSIFLENHHSPDWKFPNDLGCLKVEIPSFSLSYPQSVLELLKKLVK